MNIIEAENVARNWLDTDPENTTLAEAVQTLLSERIEAQERHGYYAVEQATLG